MTVSYTHLDVYKRQLVDRLEVGNADAVVGITASGSAPYVLAALGRAKERGSVTIGLCTNAHSRLEGLCDVTIAPLVGPEVISGSTRMKSGTAQKMVLNMLTTCSMIKMCIRDRHKIPRPLHRSLR